MCLLDSDALRLAVGQQHGGDQPAQSHWSRLFTAPFTYFFSTDVSGLTGAGTYQFAALFAVALFGWLIERRHGGIAVAALFLVGAIGGTAVAVLADAKVPVAGANGGALALLCTGPCPICSRAAAGTTTTAICWGPA